jgi:hypothetical protein
MYHAQVATDPTNTVTHCPHAAAYGNGADGLEHCGGICDHYFDKEML